jgi:outer membrane protein OmpA-like peptidoglycan-associated protein
VGDAAKVVDQLQVTSPQQVQTQLGELPQVTFLNNSATLTPEGQTVVANVAAILKANPTVRISIEGHTDTRGSEAANLTLSQARAQAVLSTLVSLGIAADRLTATGFGGEPAEGARHERREPGGQPARRVHRPAVTTDVRACRRAWCRRAPRSGRRSGTGATVAVVEDRPSPSKIDFCDTPCT